jgi:hypothetical protein
MSKFREGDEVKMKTYAMPQRWLVGTPRCGVRSAQRADPTRQVRPKTEVLHRHALTIGWLALLFLCLTFQAVAEGAAKILYQNNFEKAAIGPVPEDFLVLDGNFTVAESEGNKYLELPGAPLDIFGVLFGPTTNGSVCVSARVYGTGKGRRYPQFGVGIDGQNGYKLKVSPAKDAVEIYKGDESVVSVPFHWKSGTWTMFKLQIRQTDGPAWKIKGKVWPQTETEPKEWTITLDEKTPPRAGRASIWGSPISGTPIRFDDLLLTGE